MRRDAKRWQKAFDAGDEEAFCHLFGPDEIPPHLGEFLGYFMVRKVSAGQELLKAAGTVTGKLARWLEQQAYIESDAAEVAVDARGTARASSPRPIVSPTCSSRSRSRRRTSTLTMSARRTGSRIS